VLTVFQTEKAIFMREKQSSLYTTLPFYLSKLIGEFPIQMLPPFIYGAIAYWMVNLNPQADRFFIFM